LWTCDMTLREACVRTVDELGLMWNRRLVPWQGWRDLRI
jgi:hypothetical protein